MKYLNLLLIVIFISSCGSTKQVVQNTPKEEPKEIVEVETIPEIVETPIVTEVEVEVEVEENEQPETIIATPEIFNHDAWNNLLKDYVSETGKVNYKGFKANRKRVTNYISSLGVNIPNEVWSKEDKIAYWINAYNAMTVDLIIRNYPLQSIKDIKDPWKQRLWKLGSKWYNLEEIEHQILRKMNEPRIHFGIVCASFSCPKLQNEAFNASNLEMQLTKVTRTFLADEKRNKISENNLKLSKIFKWFKKDFEQNGSLIDFINKYSDLSISEKTKKLYLDYNWSLNN